MKRKCRTNYVVCVLAMMLFVPSGWAGEQGAKVPAYQIKSIRAHLFFNHTGTVSENIVENPSYEPGGLWNTIIGEGSAGSPSRATMVVVELAGKPGSYQHERKLRLVAQAEDAVVLNKVLDLGGFSKDGRFYGAFWLYDTGCQPLVLTATMVGQSVDSKLVKTIGFECGE